MQIKPKTAVAMIVTAESPSATRSDVRAGDHGLVIDEPPIRHGTDKGPTPLETLLASFAGCTNVILNRISAKQKITISDMKVRVTGHLDRRGIDGEAIVGNVFPEIELGMSAACGERPPTWARYSRHSDNAARFQFCSAHPEAPSRNLECFLRVRAGSALVF